MIQPDEDTIFAVASGSGRAAIAIMRISGSRAGPTLDTVCGGRPEPRRACLRALRNREGEVLDRALVIWMPGPHSYAGEDSAELHLHAGPAVIDGVADTLVRLGLRPAGPGEFTRRAFLNGRMDLLEAEGVADLVAAETASQRRQALQQMEGGLGELYRGWAERLRRVLAEQEALIDFPDEALPGSLEAGLMEAVAALMSEMRQHLDDGGRGQRVRDGIVCAVAGPPNVGKSSLVNALVSREIAIVSPAPGTTRDAIETRLEIEGLLVTLVDTAGVRETKDPVEAEGVRRARERAASADILLAVTDASSPRRPDIESSAAVIRVANKADLAAPLDPEAIAVSARTGAGVTQLRSLLARNARWISDQAGPPPLTRSRHRAAIERAWCGLSRAQGASLPELRAEELRLGLRAIGELTGSVGVEDLLDTIFGQFCIGK